jgi:cytochrome b pre-mRNA-processing protein 3
LSRWSIKALLGRAPFDVAVRELYSATVAQARQIGFYRDWAVPDSAIGRFDVIVLHSFFILHRLQNEPSAEKFGEAYCGEVFADMDRNLREMGIGDLSVGKKVRKLAEGFYGRAAAYDKALAGDDAELCAALERNLFAEAGPESKVLQEAASYVRRNERILEDQSVTDLISGRIVFAPLDGGSK